MDLVTNIIGYTGAVVGTFLMVPQIVKSWKTKKVSDLSWGMVVLYFVNCMLWLTYGLLIASMPVAVANGVALIVSIVQIVLKTKYS